MNNIPKELYNFGDPDDPKACYACGCLDFDENWDFDGLDGFVDLRCSYCGAKQGWWYKKLWMEKNKKEIKRVNKNRASLWKHFCKSIERNYANRNKHI